MASVVEVPAFRTVQSRVDLIQPARIKPKSGGPQKGDVVGDITFHTGPCHLPVLTHTKS